jgi:cupin domain
VRFDVMQGEYHWRKHGSDDEFFFVPGGSVIIDLEGRSVALSPQQGFVVPKGVVHRTRAPEKAVVPNGRDGENRTNRRRLITVIGRTALPFATSAFDTSRTSQGMSG